MMGRILILLLATAVAAAAAEPVGLLSTVAGDVRILRAGQKTPATARTADLISDGDHILTGRNSEAAFLFCPESRAAKIPAESDVLFSATTIQVRKGKLVDERKVPSCRLPANLALSAASQQQTGIVRLRGSNLMLRFPSRTAVANLQPTFRWSAVEGAKSYEIRLMDREERVLWKQMVSATEAAYPAGGQPLEWGQKYVWRVAARDGDDIMTEAGSSFQILPAEQAQRVQASASALRKLVEETPADNGPRFLLAFLYEDNGMLDEAARSYGDLADRMGAQPWIQSRLADLLNKLGWERVEPGRTH